MDGPLPEWRKTDSWVRAELLSHRHIADRVMSFDRNQCWSLWSSAPNTRRTWTESETMSTACTLNTSTTRWVSGLSYKNSIWLLTCQLIGQGWVSLGIITIYLNLINKELQGRKWLNILLLTPLTARSYDTIQNLDLPLLHMFLAELKLIVSN